MRGRKRHGTGRKESHTVCLDAEAVYNLEQLGNGNLSAGVAIAEHMARGKAPPSIEEVRRRAQIRTSANWIVFRIVDGPPDPPADDRQMDAWGAV